MKKLLSVLVICSLMTVLFGVGATTASASQDEKEFILVNHDSGKVLTTCGNNLQVNELVINSCQKWHIVERGTTCGRTYYTIENVGSGKVMEVENSSTSRYANVQQAAYTGCNNQLWFIDCYGIDDFANYYHIENVNSGKLLSVSSPAGDEGANVQQYDITDRRHQLWSIVTLSEHTEKL